MKGNEFLKKPLPGCTENLAWNVPRITPGKTAKDDLTSTGGVAAVLLGWCVRSSQRKNTEGTLRYRGGTGKARICFLSQACWADHLE